MPRGRARQSNHARVPDFALRPFAAVRLGAVSVCAPLFLTGCYTTFFENRADTATYTIIENASEAVLGGAQPFTIDTEYSDRDPDDITAQEILEDRRTSERIDLTIGEALAMAIARSREYQTEKETLYLAALELSSEQFSFRPQFALDSTVSRTWIPSEEELLGDTVVGDAVEDAADAGVIDSETTTALTGRFFDERATVASNLSVSQMFFTGASMSLNLANDLLRFYTGDSRKSAVSVVSGNLVQPLLRGAGRTVAAEQLTQAYRDVAYAVRDFSHFQNEFATGIVVSYYRLLQQRDTVNNQYNDYRSRVANTEYLRARSVDRESALDVGDAEQDELSAKSSYINAVVSLKDSLDAFKLTLGLPQSTDLRLSQSEMDRLREAGPLPLFLTAEHGFDLALLHRLPLMNAIDQFEDSQRQVKVTANALLPGLDLFAETNGASQGEIDYRDFDIRDFESSVGIALDIPINPTLERNAFRASIIAFEAQIRSLGESFDTVRGTVEQGIRTLDRLRRNYVIQQSAVELAAKRVDAAQLRLQAGTAIFRDLREAQDALIGAQNDVTASLVDYLEARLQLLVDVGILDPAVDEFWLDAAAGTYDLSKPSGNELPEDFLSGDEVLSPDELFPE